MGIFRISLFYPIILCIIGISIVLSSNTLLNDNTTCDSDHYGYQCQHHIACQSQIEAVGNCYEHGTLHYDPETGKCDTECTCTAYGWTGTTCGQILLCTNEAAAFNCGRYGVVGTVAGTMDCQSSCSCLYGYSGPLCNTCNVQCFYGQQNPAANCMTDLIHTPPCTCPNGATGRYCQYYNINTTLTLYNRSLPEWIVSLIDKNNTNNNLILYNTQNDYDDNDLYDMNILANDDDDIILNTDMSIRSHEPSLQEFLDSMILSFNKHLGYNTNTIANTIDKNNIYVYGKNSIKRTIINAVNYKNIQCPDESPSSLDDDSNNTITTTTSIPSILSLDISIRIPISQQDLLTEAQILLQKISALSQDTRDITSLLSSVLDEYEIPLLGSDEQSQICLQSTQQPCTLSVNQTTLLDDVKNKIDSGNDNNNNDDDSNSGSILTLYNNNIMFYYGTVFALTMMISLYV